MKLPNRTAKRLGFDNAEQMYTLAKNNTSVGIQVALLLSAYEQGVYKTVTNPNHNRHIRKLSGLSRRQFIKGMKDINKGL